MSLKPCPFCGGSAQHEPDDVYGDDESRRDECTKCHASAPSDIWNTRAAPTMKAWEWSEGDGADEVEACLDFKAFVYRNKGERMWTAYVGTERVVVTDKLDDAQAACVAYVEAKLKEWLA